MWRPISAVIGGGVPGFESWHASAFSRPNPESIIKPHPLPMNDGA
jgi:hypothetical protein